MAVLALFPLRRAADARPSRAWSGSISGAERGSSLNVQVPLDCLADIEGQSTLTSVPTLESTSGLDRAPTLDAASTSDAPFRSHVRASEASFDQRPPFDSAFDHGRPSQPRSLIIEQLVMSEGDDPRLQQRDQVQRSSQAQSRSQEQRLRDLVVHQGDFVARSLRNLGVWGGELDDCVQKVFLVAARRLPEIELGKERAFLFSCAQNTAAHFRRSLARKREVSEESLMDRSDPELLPDQLTERKRYRELLDRLLETMDENIRATFILYSFEEMTMAEIADVLGVPPGTVASRLRRAREIFKQEMTRLNLFDQFRTDQVRNKQEIA